MSHSLLAGVSLAASLAFLGACHQGPSVTPSQRSAVPVMPAEQRALIKRYGALNQRFEKVRSRLSDTAKDLTSMERKHDAKEDEERVSRYTVIYTLKNLNNDAKALMETKVAAQKVLMPGHAAALASCAHLNDFTFTASTVNFPKIMNAMEPDIINVAYKEVSKIIELWDELQWEMGHTEMADVAGLTPKVDMFETGLVAVEAKVEETAQAIIPINRELWKDFLDLGHRQILMDLHFKNCAAVIDDYKTRQGPFSDLPQTKKPVLMTVSRLLETPVAPR